MSNNAGTCAEMFELLPPKVAKAIMAERLVFPASGSCEKATSIDRIKP